VGAGRWSSPDYTAARVMMETSRQLQLREAQAARELGSEVGADGHRVGRDPRKMTRDELRLLGHEPKSPVEALRARCLGCCVGSADEVRKCMALACPSWPFRMGINPWRTVSEGRRESGRRLAAKRAAKSSQLKSNLAADGGMAPAATLPPPGVDHPE
jgi:hypothetical protein